MTVNLIFWLNEDCQRRFSSYRKGKDKLGCVWKKKQKQRMNVLDFVEAIFFPWQDSYRWFFKKVTRLNIHFRFFSSLHYLLTGILHTCETIQFQQIQNWKTLNSWNHFAAFVLAPLAPSISSHFYQFLFIHSCITIIMVIRRCRYVLD